MWPCGNPGFLQSDHRPSVVYVKVPEVAEKMHKPKAPASWPGWRPVDKQTFISFQDQVCRVQCNANISAFSENIVDIARK